MPDPESDSATSAPAQREAAAEWAPIDELVPWGANPRKNDAAVPQVAASIRRFGFGSSIVARRADRRIVAGHTRRRACLLLIDQWPKATILERSVWHADAVRIASQREVVVRFVDLSDHDAELLALADNKIGEASEWDEEGVARILERLRAAEVDVTSGTGFDQDEVDRILAAAAGEGPTGTDPGEDRYKEQYGVIVMCADEAEQERVFEQLKGQGLRCRVVVT